MAVQISNDTAVPRGRRLSAAARSLLRDKLPAAAGIFLVLAVVCGVLAPLVAPHDPFAVDILNRHLPPAWENGGSWTYPLGTEALGRDVLSGTIYGLRQSLLIASVVGLLAGSAGTFFGLVAGYRGGWAGSVIMRITDAQGAFPTVLLITLLVVTFGGGGPVLLIAALSLTGWMPYTRLVRGLAVQLRSTGFVTAAEITGCTPRRVMLRHLLPSIFPTLVTLAILEFAATVLSESTISYLGLGMQPPNVSLGLLVAENQEHLATAWWPVVVPGLMLALLVLSLNIVGTALQARMDPQLAALARVARSAQIARRRGKTAAPEPAPSPEPERNGTAPPTLAVDGLGVAFETVHGRVPAVVDVSLHVRAGTTLGILGESGSGKSVTMSAVTGLLAPGGVMEKGVVSWEGKALDSDGKVALRGSHITLINQEPAVTLDPLTSVGKQLVQVLVKHRKISRREAWRQAGQLFEALHVPDARRRLRQYPWEFSGGMAQRVLIAMALAPEPKLLVADEPTTALDVTIQAQILRVLKEIQATTGIAMVIISHDVAVLENVTDHVAVMYAGRIVESGPTAEVFRAPKHPYTRGLLASTPRLAERMDVLEAIPGSPPSRPDLDGGCAFRVRCPLATERCTGRPPLVVVAGRADDSVRKAACWYAG